MAYAFSGSLSVPTYGSDPFWTVVTAPFNAGRGLPIQGEIVLVVDSPHFAAQVESSTPAQATVTLGSVN
jgi:hypothetical protein